jgi:hypothetical protein
LGECQIDRGYIARENFKVNIGIKLAPLMLPVASEYCSAAKYVAKAFPTLNLLKTLAFGQLNFGTSWLLVYGALAAK